MIYDSTVDSLKHIKRIGEIINSIIRELLFRSECHDSSKLQNPEKVIFDEFTLKLKNSTYGSEEYKNFLKEMQQALDHHYKMNLHHPEHYVNGINDMDLLDILEMVCDWKASSERHTDGNIYESIKINKKRFGISDQLEQILINTAKRYFNV
jgi:hypothetical protein